MDDGFRVEPGAVTTAGSRLSTLAGDLSGTDLVAPLTGTAAAVSGSGTAAQAGRLSGELSAALSQLVTAVGAMAGAATTTAENYLQADGGSARMFGPQP